MAKSGWQNGSGTITWRLQVHDVIPSATSVAITDTLPDNLGYVPGSLAALDNPYYPRAPQHGAQVAAVHVERVGDRRACHRALCGERGHPMQCLIVIAGRHQRLADRRGFLHLAGAVRRLRIVAVSFGELPAGTTLYIFYTSTLTNPEPGATLYNTVSDGTHKSTAQHVIPRDNMAKSGWQNGSGTFAAS